jgi:aminopeptidase N
MRVRKQQIEMRTETPHPIHLKDYRQTPYSISHVRLDVRLAETGTLVRSRFVMEPRGDAAAIALDGEQITLKQLVINGVTAEPGSYSVTDTQLVIHKPPAGSVTLEIAQQCDPSANTELSGLYLSNGMYCTQMESEGFRRFAYFYDRPDIMATYEVHVDAPVSLPSLLSNGNPVERGVGPETGRHYAVWRDPHPKPTYLFALVAGDLASIHDTFTTAEGRTVALGIHVEKGKEDRCAWAMESLKASMRWDEQRFGRCYDLDVFNIVAVSNFNMGAMENKGLNIFNDKYVLAKSDTATDTDYLNIEAIIAHEYFHNWTGNRITCRDWFQLCLKEGLTVFRDQEFTSDLRSRAVKRIQDVRTLRARQFPEDQGPLAHPVRPSSYIEINNFYTPTVYEKGAEICRMLHTLLGESDFRRAMDLYFERHDGEAATVEDFVRCMSKVSGRDLTQFFRWYEQAGTPTLTVKTKYDSAAGAFTVSLAQETKPTPGQTHKQPLHMPIALALLGQDGRELQNTVVEFKTAEQEFVFKNIGERPVLSINRGFSSPVVTRTDAPLTDLLFLTKHDTDPFNRWDAAQTVARSCIIETMHSGTPVPAVHEFAEALNTALRDQSADPAFKALMLTLPPEAEVAAALGSNVDSSLIHRARELVRGAIAASLGTELQRIVRNDMRSVPYRPDSGGTAQRALRAAALALLAAHDTDTALEVAEKDIVARPNMTTEIAALMSVLPLDDQRRDALLDRFFDRYKHDPLIIDKWFQLQAQIPGSDSYKRIERLLTHPSFTLTTPNRVYALAGSFTANNLSGFHAAHGEGYRVVADIVIALNGINAQVASRIATGFRSWNIFHHACQYHAKRQMERILATPDLKRDVFEIISRTLKA